MVKGGIGDTILCAGCVAAQLSLGVFLAEILFSQREDDSGGNS